MTTIHLLLTYIIVELILITMSRGSMSSRYFLKQMTLLIIQKILKKCFLVIGKSFYHELIAVCTML